MSIFTMVNTEGNGENGDTTRKAFQSKAYHLCNT